MKLYIQLAPYKQINLAVKNLCKKILKFCKIEIRGNSCVTSILRLG